VSDAQGQDQKEGTGEVESNLDISVDVQAPGGKGDDANAFIAMLRQHLPNIPEFSNLEQRVGNLESARGTEGNKGTK
jgi:hypothetical protein